MARKSKDERRYIAISRIIRKRNYGFKKATDAYTKDIYKTIFTKTQTKEMGRTIYNSLKGVRNESLDDVFRILNDKIEKLSPKITKYINTFLKQGSSKIFDHTGKTLKLQKPKYDNAIKKLTENNLKYVKGIVDDQRKTILDEITKGIKDGKSYSQMADKIVDKVENMSHNRAKLIANNEGHLAHAKAQEDTMKLNGIKKYQWVTAQDDRVSAICQSLHREVFTFGKTGKMNWKDVDGKTHSIYKSPRPIRDSHIGCRCVTIPLID